MWNRHSTALSEVIYFRPVDSTLLVSSFPILDIGQAIDLYLMVAIEAIYQIQLVVAICGSIVFSRWLKQYGSVQLTSESSRYG